MQKYNKILLLIYIFFLSPSASAFLAKNHTYRLQDNMPTFKEDYTEFGEIYYGIGYSWMKGEIGDIKSTGLSEFYNQQLYNAQFQYAALNSADPVKYNLSTKGVSSGIVSIGYSPKRTFLSLTRHELEIGMMSFGRDIPYISSNNAFCGDLPNCSLSDTSQGYSALSYSIKQKYLLYNFYIHPFKQYNFNVFVGGGYGGALSNVYLTGAGLPTSTSTTSTSTTDTTDTSAITGNAGVSKNVFSNLYTVFVGSTYDINESLVLQGKLKAMVINKPHYFLSSNYKINEITYLDSNSAGNKYMIKIIGFELVGIFS